VTAEALRAAFEAIASTRPIFSPESVITMSAAEHRVWQRRVGLERFATQHMVRWALDGERIPFEPKRMENATP